MNNFINDLKYFFRTKGISQADLAKEFDCKQSFISEMLSGKKPIPNKFLLLISDKYNISLKWLLSGEGDMFEKSECNNITCCDNITNSNVIEGSPGAKITSNEKDREIEYLRTMLAEKDARISELKQIIELLKK